MYFLGLDNGVSGSIGVVREDGSLVEFIRTPIFKDLNYTKTKAWVNRVDTRVLSAFLTPFRDNCKALVERPMVNPGRFKATVSALRALEATLIVLEGNKIPYQFIDSKEWQKAILPSGIKGPELKTASVIACKRLFPTVEIKKGCDGDGLLIAEYLRRTSHAN